MDDLISREAAIARIDKCVALSGIGLEPVMAVRDIKALISVLPAVDAVPVIRCRDCEYLETDWKPNHSIDGEHFCPMISLVTSGEGFCADGKRRDDDGKDA